MTAQGLALNQSRDACEPTTVAAAYVQDEMRLRVERLAIENLGDDRVAIGEVAMMRYGAGANIEITLHVPFADVSKLWVLREPATEKVGTGLGIADVDQMAGHIWRCPCSHCASTSKQKTVVSASD